MTPESVINSADVNPKQRQCNAKKIVRKEAVIIMLRAAAEDVIERR